MRRIQVSTASLAMLLVRPSLLRRARPLQRTIAGKRRFRVPLFLPTPSAVLASCPPCRASRPSHTEICWPKASQSSGRGECLNGRADLFGLDSHLPPRAPALPPRECHPNPACPVAQFVRLMNALIPPQPTAPMGLAYMMAQFTVPQPGTLATYAMQCGFIGFDWQQQITTDPGGSVGAGTQPADPEPLIATGNVAYLGKPVSVTDNLCELWIDGCSLIAPPAYADPPYGGYVGGNVVNAYPFFIPYTAKFLTPPASPADGVCLIENCSALGLPYAVSPDDRTLSFLDAPRRTQLPKGTFVAFKTTLVGISTRGSVRCGFGSRLYCTPLYSWTWATNFTGSSGEVRVTSINGIPQ